MRNIESLLEQYASDHQNSINQAIHLLCVPAIVWSVTALLWTLPVPGGYLRPGAFCGLAMFLALSYYWRLSRRLALGMLLAFTGMALINYWLAQHFGMTPLLWLALSVFALAWIGQFLGHRIEGKRPSFFTDLVYLLIGPLWTLRKLYARIGLGH